MQAVRNKTSQTKVLKPKIDIYQGTFSWMNNVYYGHGLKPFPLNKHGI